MQRRREAEWMDEDGADPRELARSLAFIRKVNRLLGYTRATIKHLQRFSRGWKKGEKIRLIDLATGSADIPRAILRWADRRGFDVEVVAVDRHPATVREAARAVRDPKRDPTPGAERSDAPDSSARIVPDAEESGASLRSAPGVGQNPISRADPFLPLHDPRLKIVQADVFNLPFAPGSFDYALTAMFLHHLGEDEAVAVLRVMGGLARRGVIVADLLRHRRAYLWISLFTLAAGPMVRHDARASVAQAFDRGEILKIRERAGLTWARYFRHFGHRFVLAGEKRAEDQDGSENQLSIFVADKKA